MAEPLVTREEARIGEWDLDDEVSAAMPPEVRGAFEDAQERSGLLSSLVAKRSASGLTQAQVAERMGTTQSAVSELEGGGTDPFLSTFQRYARAVGCVIEVTIYGSPLSAKEADRG